MNTWIRLFLASLEVVAIALLLIPCAFFFLIGYGYKKWIDNLKMKVMKIKDEVERR